MKEFYVYIHVRCDTNTVFYVGKGKERRSHSRVSRNKYWHNIVNKYGYTVEILDYFDTEQEALNREKALIQSIKAANIPLCNMTDGGDGLSGRKMDPNLRAKLSSPEIVAKIQATRAATLLARGIIPRPKPVKREPKPKIEKPKRTKYLYTGTKLEDNSIIGPMLMKELVLLGFDKSNVNHCAVGRSLTYRGYTFTRELIS